MARKQPHEIKDDYREVEKITDETEQFMEGYPVNIIDNDGNKRTLKTPFVDTTKGNELLEKNMEMNGVMKDNLKTTKTQKSRERNLSCQKKIEDNARNIRKKLDIKKV